MKLVQVVKNLPRTVAQFAELRHPFKIESCKITVIKLVSLMPACEIVIKCLLNFKEL